MGTTGDAERGALPERTSSAGGSSKHLAGNASAVWAVPFDIKTATIA
jgi:hypothetical protein